MMMQRCQQERVLQDLIRRGYWPHGCEPELIDHVKTCSECAECLLLTTTFQAARASAELPGPLAGAGTLWWRAQLRNRNAAIERITKPCQGATIFALSLAVAAAVVLVLQGSVLEPLRPLSSVFATWNLTLMLSAGGILAVLCGVVVYLAFDS